VPGAQTTGVQTLDPVDFASVHTGQGEHDDAPLVEYVPTTQLRQDVDPVREVYMRAAQVAHCVPPGVSLKEPALQLAHEVLPAAEIVPTPHEVQLDEPVTEEKVPAAQLVHIVWPAMLA